MISKNIQRLLSILPEDVKDGVDEVLSYSQPNPPTLKLLAETALDIKIKTGKNPLDEKFHQLAKDSGIKDAVDKLRELRNEELSLLTAKIKKQVTELGTSSVSVKFDPRFEDSFLELGARIYSTYDLEKVKKDIEELINNKKLDEVFRTYNGN